MKTFLTLSAVVAAFSLLAINVAAGATLLFAAAFAPIAVADYTRASRVLKLPATVALGARRERFGLAA